MMAIALPDDQTLSDEVLEALRLRALRGRDMGMKVEDVAEMLGVSRASVYRWYKAYKAGGLKALPRLRTGRPVGAGRILNEDQSRHICGLIDSHVHNELGIGDVRWSRRAVCDLIHNEFGINVTEPTAGRYIKNWKRHGLITAVYKNDG